MPNPAHRPTRAPSAGPVRSATGPGFHRLRSMPSTALPGLLILFPLLAACSGSDSWAGRIETVDGVVHLYNPDIPLWGEDFVPFIEVEVLGGPGSPEEALFSEPLAVEVAGDGTRFVLDGTDQRILRFAPDGAYLGSFGRAGEGPGEFTGAADLALLPNGELVVTDRGRRRLSRFTPEGRFLDSVQRDDAYGQITADARGRIIAHQQPRTPSVFAIRLGDDASGPATLIDVLTPGGERVGGYGEIREFEGMMLGMWMNRVQPAVTVGDTVVLDFLGEDWIQVWSPEGELVRVVHRNLPFEPVEPVEESQLVQNDDGSVSISMQFEFDLLATGFGISSDGKYWAVLVALTQTDRRPRPPEQENTPREDEILQRWGIDLFDSDGRWLARQDLGTDYPLAALDWESDGLYLINHTGDATVRRLRMNPPPGDVQPPE
jgi:hypothetical protein